MRTPATVALVLLSVLPAAAQTAKKAPPPFKLPLVQAYCDTPSIGPCSTATFATGTVVLMGGKQPGPTCPKTGQPADAAAGTVKLIGVTRNGTPLDGASLLTASVFYKTTFGTDPDGNCGLAGLQIDTLAATATLSCKKGRCSGTFHPIACLPKTCADTRVTTELSNLVVNDDAQLALARPGTFLAPSASDAP